MIQRIQTLFLFAAALLQVVFLTTPIATFTFENGDIVKLHAIAFKSINGETLVSTFALFILAVSVLLLILFDVFLYKKRILQIRICIYTILLNAGLIGMALFLIINFIKNNAVVTNSYNFAATIPLANIILLFLAFRGIRKDELLIKAYERLR